MATTDRHGFLLWAAGFTQSDTILNDLLLKLERRLNVAVVSRTETAPVGGDADGDMYIIPASPTGAFSGFDEHDVVILQEGTWYANAPISGIPAYVEDDAELVLFNGTDWEVTSTVNPLGDADFAGGEGFMRKTGAGTYEVIKTNLAAAVDPAVTDDSGDGYAIGSLWLNTTLDKAFIALDVSVGAAVWREISNVDMVISGDVPVVADTDYVLTLDAPWAGTILTTRTKTASGTCTCTFKVNTTALGGTANSASSTAQEQAHSSSNTFVKGDKLQFTVSSNSSALNLAVTIYGRRTGA